MKKITEAYDEIFKEDISQPLDEMVKELLKDQEVKTFINNNNLDYDTFINNLNVFLGYQLKKENCQKCLSLNECKQGVKGMKPVLTKDGEYIQLELEACTFQETYDNYIKKANNLQVICGNIEMLKSDELYINNERKEALKQIKTFIQAYDSDSKTKGIYIHGPYGCGKTYLIAYLAKELANNNHQVMFAYYPDLVRKIKSLMFNDAKEELINELKSSEILILDDFGGETPSSYIRDEVLLPILQERLQFKRPTFMTSNIGPKQIVEHLAEGTKDIDEIRASRIYERIRSLMTFIALNDKNYR